MQDCNIQAYIYRNTDRRIYSYIRVKKHKHAYSSDRRIYSYIRVKKHKHAYSWMDEWMVELMEIQTKGQTDSQWDL